METQTLNFMRKCKTIIRQLFFLAFLIGASSNFLFAQERDLMGKVTEADTGEPVPGANISIKGTTSGTITDLDGKFTIQVKEGQSLIVSFIGMQTQEILIENQTSLDVKLLTEATDLETIVVVGYGTQKKIETTGAVASVNTEEMTNVIASDFTKALQGQVAGVSVTESNGRPGEKAYVNIRGIGSLNADREPLYVVDGIPAEGNPNIPAEEIASISVLKDGASSAIYGTRASNGVIIITTKKGKAGKTKVSVSSYYGIQNIISATPLMGTEEQIYIEQQISRLGGNNTLALADNPYLSDKNTDFVNEVLNNNAAIQATNVSLSSGSENLKFNLNGNYYKQDGVMILSGYERYSTRANTSFEKGKFKAFASLSIQREKQEREPGGLYNTAQFQKPWRPSISNLELEGDNMIVQGAPVHVVQVSYLASRLSERSNVDTKSTNIGGNFSYEIIEGLSIKQNLGYSTSNRETANWRPRLQFLDRDGNRHPSSIDDARLQIIELNNEKFTSETMINFDKSFGKHNIKLMAGYSMEKAQQFNRGMTKQNFISNDIKEFDAASALTSISGFSRVVARTGKIFRAQYNYNDKYMLSASIRQDGSSNFKEGSQYGYFPGVSLGWNINKESFMSNLEFIDNLKLRASYAGVGNDRITPYMFSPAIYSNVDYVYGPEGSQTLALGATQRGFANENLQWETNISRNIGLDLTLFGGMFSFNFDIYRNTKEDMLMQKRLPASMGTSPTANGVPYPDFNSIFINAGDMINEGFEIASTYKLKTKFGLNLNFTGTFSMNRNEVLSLGGDEKLIMPGSLPTTAIMNNTDPVSYMIVGKPAQSFYLIPTDGIIKTAEELAAVQEYMPDAQMGDLKYINQLTVDTDGDGIADATDNVINDEDRVYQGTSLPDFEAGLIIGADYKGFDFSAQLIYSHGGKVFNGTKLFAYAQHRHSDVYYAYSAANTASDIPANRSSGIHSNYRSFSDYFLEDASYLRVRGLSLGYTFPKNWLKDKLDKIRVYVRAQNPFTFTKYTGYDPEIGGDGLATRGIDRGNYPVSRTFIGGIQIDF